MQIKLLVEIAFLYRWNFNENLLKFNATWELKCRYLHLIRDVNCFSWQLGKSVMDKILFRVENILFRLVIFITRTSQFHYINM